MRQLLLHAVAKPRNQDLGSCSWLVQLSKGIHSTSAVTVSCCASATSSHDMMCCHCCAAKTEAQHAIA